MPSIKLQERHQQQQSLASGAAFGEYITKQRDVAPLFPSVIGCLMKLLSLEARATAGSVLSEWRSTAVTK